MTGLRARSGRWHGGVEPAAFASVFHDSDISGYGGDSDQDPIRIGMRFFVTEDGHQCVGMSEWPFLYSGSPADLSNVVGYLYKAEVLLQVKQFSGVLAPGQWNDLLFDDPTDLLHDQFYTVVVYLPGGGYAFLNNVMVDAHVSPDMDVLFSADGDTIANCVFDASAVPDPLAPPEPVWNNFNNRHYGALDVLVS